MSKPHRIIVEVFARAFAEGLSWKDVLAEAGLSRQGWTKIRRGGGAKLTTIAALTAAIDKLAGLTAQPSEGMDDGD